MKGNVLVVEDDQRMGQMLVAALGQRQFETTHRKTADEALELLAAQDFDAVVTDLKIKGPNGLDLCERIVANRPDVPVIVITAFGSLDTAVAAIRAGAYDFLTKPFETDVLAIAIERAIKHRAMREEIKRLRRLVDGPATGGQIVGSSPAIRKVYELVERVAESDSSVIITGESGTGKEVVARAIHERSRRRGGPFVAINCAAMPEALLESELFGHVKGAFTDARAPRKGLFQQAGGGTLFLDEVGELPLALQPKLLRALQEKAARPVGGDAEVAFDVRIIAATNRDLEVAIEDKTFREDLYYRLNVIHIEMPPLRARGNDILALAEHFITRFSGQSGKPVRGVTPEAAEALLNYAWPGNVRELQNSLERAVALTRAELIGLEDLPERVRTFKRSHVLLNGEEPSDLVPLDEVERRYILRVLEAVGGNKRQAAQLLGVDRKTLYRRLEKYNGGNGAARESEPPAARRPAVAAS